MAGGWIKVHRKLLDSGIASDPIVAWAWVALLLSANWDRRQLLDGTWLESGELILSQDKFAKSIGITRQQLRRSIDSLRRCENLTIKSTKKGTHVTISNWRTYQSDDEEEQPRLQPDNNQQPTKSQPTDEKERKKVTIKKERKTEKEVKKEEEKKAFLEVPEDMQAPEFLVAWQEWVQHKVEIKDPLTPLAAKKLINRLKGWGLKRAIAAIDLSIERKWKGVYEESRNGQAGRNQQADEPEPCLAGPMLDRRDAERKKQRDG